MQESISTGYCGLGPKIGIVLVLDSKDLSQASLLFIKFMDLTIFSKNKRKGRQLQLEIYINKVNDSYTFHEVHLHRIWLYLKLVTSLIICGKSPNFASPHSLFPRS